MQITIQQKKELTSKHKNQKLQQQFNLADQQKYIQNYFQNYLQNYITKIIPKINKRHNKTSEIQSDVFQICQNPDGNINIEFQYPIKKEGNQDKNIDADVQFEVEGKNRKSYSFQDVIKSQTLNTQIFDKYVKQLAKSTFQGKNCCICAFGQTGSGKSSLIFKLQNKQQNQKSLLEQSISQIQKIFQSLSTQEQQKYSMNLSCIKIYNQHIIDLMSKDIQQINKPIFHLSLKNQPKIRQNKQIGVYIQGLTIAKITKQTLQTHKTTFEQLAHKYFVSSIKRKQVNNTNMGQSSSRSSVLYNIQIVYHVNNNLTRVGKLTFVDLPGSQRIYKTGVSLIQQEQTKRISQSLGCFIRVMESISKQSKFTPYRESRLTRILQNQLKDSCKIIIFYCLSPDKKNFDENLSTLRAANCIKKQSIIKIKANYISKTVSSQKKQQQQANILLI